MVMVKYEVVEHDGGWAYQLGQTYSETFASHAAARAAAIAVAHEQRVPDQTTSIEYADETGAWITERADGHDRPDTSVEG